MSFTHFTDRAVEPLPCVTVYARVVASYAPFAVFAAAVPAVLVMVVGTLAMLDIVTVLPFLSATDTGTPLVFEVMTCPVVGSVSV
ncbi:MULTISPECIES: hypothetical protein [unclassified Curtobacterium]|uniref:hypothetical protein n=1 Tax=unclassified Curtobacterium TaxID=257496 RepID=UPI00140476DC|nr:MULTISPECIES: hypothetical protein [unclassified Curtobacterium]